MDTFKPSADAGASDGSTCLETSASEEEEGGAGRSLRRR